MKLQIIMCQDYNSNISKLMNLKISKFKDGSDMSHKLLHMSAEHHKDDDGIYFVCDSLWFGYNQETCIIKNNHILT